MISWQSFKAWAGVVTGLSDSTLHALGGMLVLVVLSALLRRVPWSWQSWLALLIAEIGNETHDMLNPVSGEDRLGASIHDLWVTMFGPTLLLVLTPWLIRLAARREIAGDVEEDAGG